MSRKKLFDKIDTSDLWDESTSEFESKVMAQIDQIEAKKIRRKKNVTAVVFLVAAAVICSVYISFERERISNEEAYQFVYETTLEASEYEYEYEDYNF